MRPENIEKGLDKLLGELFVNPTVLPADTSNLLPMKKLAHQNSITYICIERHLSNLIATYGQDKIIDELARMVKVSQQDGE
jgi:hypothetical protein